MEDPNIEAPYLRLSPFISILIVIVAVVGWAMIVSTIYAYIHLDYIRSNWNTEKCKPTGILIGGQENLKDCLKPILGEVVGKATFPLTYGSLGLTKLFLDLSNSIQQLRVMFDYLRVSFTNITREIFGRIVSLMIPLQSMFITMKDMFARMYAVFATAIYMGLAVILTMKKVLEMILTFVILILIALAALIVIMWIFPFSWAVAATFTAIFVSISIPLAMFVSAVGRVTDLGIPKIPSKPHVCFDKYTVIYCADNQIKPIYKIKIGDVLEDGSVVVSKLKLLLGDAVMYSLNGVKVTGSHLVRYKSTWIPVSMHPQSIELANYKRDKVYCLNTSNGRIRLKNNEFTDWNEMLDDDFTYNVAETPVKLKNGQIIPIQCIMLGDVLHNGETVTGLVKTFHMGEGAPSFNKWTVRMEPFNTKYYHLYTKIII